MTLSQYVGYPSYTEAGGDLFLAAKLLWAPSSNLFLSAYPISTLDNRQQVFSTNELNRRSTFGELYLLLLSPFRPFSYRTTVFVEEMAMAELYFC